MSSVNVVPGTLVAIVSNGPRYSMTALGLGSYVSMCEHPPGCQIMIMAVLSRLDAVASPACSAFCACSRKIPGRLKLANPARPAWMKARRLPDPKFNGPGQARDVVLKERFILTPRVRPEWQSVRSQ